MCVRSQQVTLWDLLDAQTPSSEGSPASLGLSQANNAEQTTPVTCGPSTTVLSATCVHGGSSARTCPVCCLKVPTQSSPIWRQRATPAGRSYWVLTTSARRTDASECSLSHNWPTPTAWEQQESVETWQARREAVKAKAQNGNGFGVPLDMAVQMWPTPRAASPGSRPNGKGGKVLAEEVEIAEGIRQRNTLWPTPTSHPEDQTLDAWKRRAQMKAQNGINLHLKLGVAVQMWPTPTTQDGKNAAGPSQWNRNSWPLNVAAVAGQAGPQGPEDRNMLGKNRARLNPRWVAQLMGFPADWLDGVEVPSRG